MLKPEIQRAVEAQSAHLEALDARNAALDTALAAGCTPYSIAQAMRAALGEQKALTAEAIRRRKKRPNDWRISQMIKNARE